MRCHFPNKLYLLIYTVSLLLDLLFPSYSNICMCLHVHKYLIILFSSAVLKRVRYCWPLKLNWLCVCVPRSSLPTCVRNELEDVLIHTVLLEIWNHRFWPFQPFLVIRECFTSFLLRVSLKVKRFVAFGR